MRDLLSSLQLELHAANRLLCDTTWAQDGRHLHNDPFTRLYYLQAGSAEIWHHDRHFRLSPGHLYLIPAHTPSRYRCPCTMELVYLHYTARLGWLGPLERFVAWPFEVALKDCRWVEDRLTTLLGEERSEPSGYLLRDGALRQLLSLFAAVALPVERTVKPGVARLIPVLRHMEEHLAERIHLEDLAALVHLQPNYFSALFTRYLGEAPSRFLQRRRVEVAAERLAASSVTLSALAPELGFSDAFHLSRTFKSFMGVSPAGYRERLLREG